MARFVQVQGPNSVKHHPLQGPEMILGRHPEVDLSLDAPEVSRRHARLSVEGDRYFLEDLGSINGTFVNSTRLQGRLELQERDQVRIGPYLLVFEASSALDTEPDVVIRAEVSAHTANLDLFKQDAASKLQVVLEIAQQLARSLDVEELLPRLLDHLLVLFRQADRGLILMREGEQLVVRASRTRQPLHGAGPVYSRSVVTRVLEEGLGIVAEDAGADERFRSTKTLNVLGIRSFVCVPFKAHDGQPMGVLQLDRFGVGSPFTPEDLHLLTAIALQASVVLENAALHADLLRQDRMKRELALARRIQEGFLAQEVPSAAAAHVELFAQVYPAQEVSGDFYDFFALDENRLAFSVADVSGKGMPAALFMIAVRTLGRHLALTAEHPAAVLQALNDALAVDNPTGMFVTMAFGILNWVTGEVVLSSGGHPPALVQRRQGKIEEIFVPRGRLLGFSRGPLPL
jgi:sigma-B regulation protein RsbU (phosphoserine phosphatase)